MDNKPVKGKVQTVLGLVDSDKLGFTLPHEHIISDMSSILAKSVNSLMRNVVNNMMKTDVDTKEII